MFLEVAQDVVDVGNGDERLGTGLGDNFLEGMQFILLNYEDDHKLFLVGVATFHFNNSRAPAQAGVDGRHDFLRIETDNGTLDIGREEALDVLHGLVTDEAHNQGIHDVLNVEGQPDQAVDQDVLHEEDRRDAPFEALGQEFTGNIGPACRSARNEQKAHGNPRDNPTEDGSH